MHLSWDMSTVCFMPDLRWGNPEESHIYVMWVWLVPLVFLWAACNSWSWLEASCCAFEWQHTCSRPRHCTELLTRILPLQWPPSSQASCTYGLPCEPAAESFLQSGLLHLVWQSKHLMTSKQKHCMLLWNPSTQCMQIAWQGTKSSAIMQCRIQQKAHVFCCALELMHVNSLLMRRMLDNVQTIHWNWTHEIIAANFW